MMKFLLTLCLSLAFFISNAQKDIQHYFAFNLMPNANGSGLVTFAIVHVNDGKIIRSSVINKAKWVRLVSGEAISEANDSLVNLFIHYEVDSCWIEYDAEYAKYGKMVYVGYDCIAIDNLWKLRYKTHPSIHGLEGYSSGFYAPTGEQWAFLEKLYGIRSQSSYCYGENLFKLLKDMADPEWKEFYIAGDLTWENEQNSSTTTNESDSKND